MGGPSWANRGAFLVTASGFVDTAPCSGVLGFRWGWYGSRLSSWMRSVSCQRHCPILLSCEFHARRLRTRLVAWRRGPIMLAAAVGHGSSWFLHVLLEAVTAFLVVTALAQPLFASPRPISSLLPVADVTTSATSSCLSLRFRYGAAGVHAASAPGSQIQAWSRLGG